MADKTTFIKIDRNIVNWRWFQDPNTVLVWLYLLTKANIEDHNYQKITVHRGEVLTSYASIARDTGLSMRNARTAIEHLKSTGEVTSKKYPKFSVFSVLNYDYYQCNPTSKVTSNRQATDKQPTSNRQHLKNDKNDKNEKEKEKNKKESVSPPPLRGAAAQPKPWEQKIMDENGWSYEEFKRWRNQ